MDKFIVEKIENNIVRCETEDKKFTDLDIAQVPDGVKCGDVLLFDGDGYKILSQETDERKKKLMEMQSRIFKKKK